MILMAFGEAHMFTVFYLFSWAPKKGCLPINSLCFLLSFSDHTGSLHFPASLRVRCFVNKGI